MSEFLTKKISKLTWFKKTVFHYLGAKDLGELEEVKFKKQFISRIGFETNILSKKETLRIEPNLNSNIDRFVVF